MDIHNIIAIILTLTFFIIFLYYPKEAAKALKISLLNMSIIIILLLFLLIFIIKGYTPIEATQKYELISPVLLFGILNHIFLIIKYRLKKDDNWSDFKKLDLE